MLKYCIRRGISMTVEEYSNLRIDSQVEKNRIMKNYKKDLMAAGMSKEVADEELEDAQDNDGYWND